MTGPLPHPERTALLEGRGATLHWDVLTGGPPATEVHDDRRAADWLWEIDGDSGARTLAYLGWARAWWPASTVAGVPALDPALLAAELAVATAAVEHLLDDEHAVERALAAAVGAVHPLAALAADPELGSAAAELAAQLAELADDHGIMLPDPVPASPSRSGFALAAGGMAEGDVVVLRGSSAVDWALVPQGTVDAAADATWTVVRRGGESVLEVSVPMAPAATGIPLAARFGPVELSLGERADGAVTGHAPVPASVLLLPAAQRVLTVYAPGFATPEAPADPDAAARRAALVAMARDRLTAPDATLTERAAAR